MHDFCLLALELDGNDVCPANFPLPKLGGSLRGLARDLYDGRGFCVVRGLDLQKYSVEDYTVIWLGMQSYIAPQQARQDKKGNMLGKFSNPSPTLLLQWARSPLCRSVLISHWPCGLVVSPRPPPDVLFSLHSILFVCQVGTRYGINDLHLG